MGCFLSYELTWTSESGAPSLPPTRLRRRTVHVECRQFLSESEAPSSVIGRMASSMNLSLSPETIDSIALQTLTISNDAIALNPNARVLGVVVSVEVVRYVRSPAELEQLMVEQVARRSAREARKTVPATKSSIESLEDVVFDEKREKLERCSICLEDYDDLDCDHQRAVRMPCSHVYHKDCIVQWLEMNHNCPLCRYALPTDN